jgi:hypothetical protein
VIIVERLHPLCIVKQIQLAFAYHVIAMSMLQMLCQRDILERSYVMDVIFVLQLLGASKRSSLFVNLVMQRNMKALLCHLTIIGSDWNTTLVALLHLNSHDCGDVTLQSLQGQQLHLKVFLLP